MTLSKHQDNHFGTLNLSDIEEKQKGLQNNNTLKNEVKSERIFKEYLMNLGLEDVDFYQFTEPELDHYLWTFWFIAHTKKGDHYTSSSLETIRYGLNMMFEKIWTPFRHNKERMYFIYQVDTGL